MRISTWKRVDCLRMRRYETNSPSVSAVPEARRWVTPLDRGNISAPLATIDIGSNRGAKVSINFSLNNSD
jgi:hypothetical protein